MAANDGFDLRMRQLVEEAVREALPDGDGQAVADAVMDRLQTAFGAAAQRRRLVSELRAAYKDGFLTGRSAGRFARWHGEIWSASQTAARLRRPTKAEAEAGARFARYNFD